MKWQKIIKRPANSHRPTVGGMEILWGPFFSISVDDLYGQNENTAVEENLSSRPTGNGISL